MLMKAARLPEAGRKIRAGSRETRGRDEKVEARATGAAPAKALTLPAQKRNEHFESRGSNTFLLFESEIVLTFHYRIFQFWLVMILDASLTSSLERLVVTTPGPKLGARFFRGVFAMHDFDASEGDGTAYNPTQLKIIASAYNEAWSEIETHFDRRNLISQTARNRLASAILKAAKTGALDKERLKNAGLSAMRYRV